MKLLVEFIEMSRIAGMRRDLIQAGGGNTSLKFNDELMVIKSSGVQLTELSETKGLSYVNPKLIVDAFDNNMDISEQDLLKQCLIEGDRPSIETFFHALTGKFTLHTHAMLVNVITSRQNGLNEIASILPNALVIGYETPGLPLSKDIYVGLKSYFDKYSFMPKIIILKNHGLIVSAETSQECLELTNDVTEKIGIYLKIESSKEKISEVIYSYFKNRMKLENPDVTYWVNNEVIRRAYKDKGNQMWDYQFCPDAIVYCGKKAYDFQKDDLDEYYHLNGKPVIIVSNDEIYIMASNVKKAKDIESLLEFTAEVALLNMNHKMDLLSNKEQNFLLNWDSEKYRQKL